MSKNAPPKGAKRWQYTIRNVPRAVDQALRQRAKALGKSINQVALEALAAATGLQRQTHDDLDFLIGSLSRAEASALERELARQKIIDEGLWR
jgi:hypothetical protein